MNQPGCYQGMPYRHSRHYRCLQIIHEYFHITSSHLRCFLSIISSCFST
jgi:hypothetical protein